MNIGVARGFSLLWVATMYGVLSMEASGAQSPSSSSVKEAIELFRDYCVMKRSDLTTLISEMNELGVPLGEDEAEPFLIGERGAAWIVYSPDYVFSITPLYKCHLHIFSRSHDRNILKEFSDMATDPPRGVSSREVRSGTNSSSLSFVWAGDEASTFAQPTVLEIRPGTKKWPDPVTSAWILTARDHITVFPAPIAPPVPPSPVR